MVTRRTILRGGCALAALGALAGCSGAEMAPDEYLRLTGEFDTVVNAADVGADPTGAQSLDPVLREHLADDTVVYLPEGTYRVGSTVTVDAFRNLGLVGSAARIVPADGFDGNLLQFGSHGGTGLLVEGIRFDIRNRSTNPRVVQAQVDDGLTLRDVTVRGSQRADRATVRVDVTSQSGRGRVERLTLPDGGAVGTAATGCLVGPASRGRLSFVDCEIEGFPRNGLYASPARGPVRVLGGRYANNGVANVRVGGRSLVRGVHVRSDRAVDGFPNMRGIRLRRGDGAVVEDCTIAYTEVTGSDGAITMARGMGSATVRNTTIRIDTDGVGAITAKPPDGDAAADSRLDCEDVRITGSAAGGQAIEVIGRHRSRFANVCVEQTGPDRNGIQFRRSNDCSLEDVSIDVTGDPVVVDQSGVERRDVCIDGGCRCDVD